MHQFRQSHRQKQRQNQWHQYDFDLMHRVGKGKFGQVYAARQRSSDFVVALKVMSRSELSQNSYNQQVKREIIIQSTLNHPNIIKLYGYFWNVTSVTLILEYAPRGELYGLLKKVGRFAEPMVGRIISQICEGVAYLHANDIIHRDIKPQNILVSVNTVKIADFGWAIYSQRKRQTFCGTLDYLSPEMLRGEMHDSKVDVWAIGILAFELATGKTPFEEQTQPKTLTRIVEDEIPFPCFLSPDFKKFVRRCLHKQPSKRPSATILLNDAFIQKFADYPLEFQQ